MEERNVLRTAIHRSCLLSGCYEPGLDTVVVSCCIFVYHLAEVGVNLF